MSETPQNKLLDTVNIVYAELDELFYNMEANHYDKVTCEVYMQHLKDVISTLRKINELNKSNK